MKGVINGLSRCYRESDLFVNLVLQLAVLRILSVG